VYKVTFSVLITIAAWLVFTAIYGYLWVNNILETETLYGYERSRLLISSAFLVNRVPYLLIALAVLIVLELLVVPGFSRKRTS
jgi:hypothetical protein